MPRRNRVPKAEPKIAIAYIRVSTDEQQLGPVAQREQIAAWAQAAGVRIVEVHEDRGVSGGSEAWDRPGLTAALAAMKQHRAGTLVVAKRDRLARDVEIAAVVERTVADLGGAVRSADGVGNGDDPDSRLLRRIHDALSERERWMIRLRTKAALGVKKARGERVGSVPFGYQLSADGVHLAPAPEEQAVLERLRELRDAGVSIRAIAARLNDEGAPARGSRWHPTTVARVLTREVVG